jgi:RNA polymerase sigma factor (sigma-70 family)
LDTSIAKTISSRPASRTRDRYAASQTDLVSAEDLKTHIEKCAVNNRESQKKIYVTFYAYAMTICGRYATNKDDGIEILNDGFLKIFKEIYRYKPAYADELSSFKGWLARIMVYTAIDHFRKNRRHSFATDINNGLTQIATRGEDAVDKISHDEILRSIQELTPVYRKVFKLFVIEDFNHEEISRRLGISVGASKSNLAKARKQLQKILGRKNRIRLVEAGT